jgi:hypothetical protein
MFMSDVIDFIERLGQDSTLRHAPRRMLDRALSDTQMSPELRAALASRDQRLLEELLGADANVCCMVNIPVEDEEVDKQKARDDKEDAKSLADRAPLSRIA